MPDLHITLFGPPWVERDGAAVHFERHKTLALLAYLAVTGRPHARDVLAALFWPEVGPREARANLRRAASQLRQLLGPDILDVEENHMALHRGAIEVDVGRFRACLAQTVAHHHLATHLCDDCLANLALAAELCRDDFLAGFSLRDAPDFDAWQTFQTESLHLELASALEKLALAYGERGDFGHAIPSARRWLALDPLCEPAHRCLMRLYAAAGDRAAAFAQYEACRTALEGELGVPPPPRRQRLPSTRNSRRVCSRPCRVRQQSQPGRSQLRHHQLTTCRRAGLSSGGRRSWPSSLSGWPTQVAGC